MNDLTDLNAAVRVSTRRWNQSSAWLGAALLPIVAMMALWFARQGDEWSLMAGLSQGTLVWSVIDFAELRHKAGLGEAIRIPQWICYTLAALGIGLMVIIIFCVKNQIIVPWWFGAVEGMCVWFAGGSIRQIIGAHPQKAQPQIRD
jgi:hypothetical protein